MIKAILMTEHKYAVLFEPCEEGGLIVTTVVGQFDVKATSALHTCRASNRGY